MDESHNKGTNVCLQSHRAMKAKTAMVSSVVIFYDSVLYSERISLGIQAIKWVVKLKQKPPAKVNVPGWGRSQVSTRRTGSRQF